MKNVYILGISAFYHNSAAALVKDGKVVAAAEEERFTRVKGDPSFPINAISFCMEKERINMSDVEKVVFYEDTAEKFGRIVTTSLINAPQGIKQYLYSIPVWITNKLWIQRKIVKELNIKSDKLMFIPHHLSHAASAFYPSPFEKAAVLTLDGVGEWTTLSWGICDDSGIKLLKELRFPDSLGLLYSAFTVYTGFKVNNGEYKMMGLAPYGKPAYIDLIKEHIVKIYKDGSFVLNKKYFSFTMKMDTINKEFEDLFGHKRRQPESEMDPFYADVAASIQAVTDEIILTTAKHIKEVTGMNNIVLAGGVALNVTAMGKLRNSGLFENVWVQPAAGDAGGALGAALYGYYYERNHIAIEKNPMKSVYLGYKIKDTDKGDDDALKQLGAVWSVYADEDLQTRIAKLINDGKIVAIARGRAEFGPRALGNRSILADARKAEMLQHLNRKIKFREGFRPFAPAVLEEDADQYFDIEGASPYMLYTFPVKEERRSAVEFGETLTETAAKSRSDIPAVTHVDYSARVQTVNNTQSPFFYGVLKKFKQLTGCSVVVNTSFNVRGEPIVNTAEDAYKCFMKSGIDYAVIGNRLFDKELQKGGVVDAKSKDKQTGKNI
ncbi:MAG: hypothetical protein E7523_09340 [Ruminococcaceae bacterium]|nr:hypothetical protein [Oscillospiraceae bacterium]